MLDLSKTVELMNSKDYKDRFKAEYLQLKIRYEKLKDFCNQIETSQLLEISEPIHTCPLKLLKEQQRIMGEYLHILEIRAIIEDIQLSYYTTF